jgi:hypothetical protein
MSSLHMRVAIYGNLEAGHPGGSETPPPPPISLDSSFKPIMYVCGLTLHIIFRHYTFRTKKDARKAKRLFHRMLSNRSLWPLVILPGICSVAFIL